MKLLRIDPPYYLYIAVVLMILFHFFIPLKHFLNFPTTLLSVLPLAAGISLNLLADSSFQKNDTTVKPTLTSSKLVTDGVFRISRNPMYLGFILILCGIGLFMGSIAPLLVVIIFAYFIYVVFIRMKKK
ncbi:DUF1295 domain-containing protein, partial [candidate division KSB1 bacterium]|nr:DUF1295 domain-containing protein [candidate division KSB1 bacterium]